MQPVLCHMPRNVWTYKKRRRPKKKAPVKAKPVEPPKIEPPSEEISVASPDGSVIVSPDESTIASVDELTIASVDESTTASLDESTIASTDDLTMASSDVQMNEIKTELEVNCSGYLHSTSLLPAVPFGIEDATSHEESLQSVSNQTSAVLGSNEVSPGKASFIHTNGNTVGVKQELDPDLETPVVRGNLIDDSRNDHTVHTTTTFNANNSTQSENSQTVSCGSNAVVKIKTEPMQLDNDLTHGTNSDAFNPPATAKNSPATNNSEKIPVINSVPSGSLPFIASHSPQEDPGSLNSEKKRVTESVGVKKEAVEHVPDVSSSEYASNCNNPEKDLPVPSTGASMSAVELRVVKTEDCKKTEISSSENQVANEATEIVKESTRMEKDMDMPCSEIQIVEPAKKIYTVIDLTSDHSNESSRASSPVNDPSLQNSTLDELSSASDRLQTWQSRLQGSNDETISRLFPTPMLKYLNLNRRLNIHVLTKLADCLKNLTIDSSEDPPAKRLKADTKNAIQVKKSYEFSDTCAEKVVEDKAPVKVTDDASIFLVSTNNVVEDSEIVAISCSNSSVKRPTVEPNVEIQSEETRESPGIRAKKMFDDIPSNLVFDPRIAQSRFGGASVYRRLPPNVTENIKITDVACSNSTLPAGRQNDAESLKKEVDFNEIKRAVERFKSPQNIDNPAVTETDCTVIPMEIEEDSLTPPRIGNGINREILKEAISLSSEYLIDIIRNSTPSDSAENCSNTSKNSNQQNLNEVGSHQNPERCYSSDSVTSSTEQSENYETPPKRAKIGNNFQERGTKKININEYRMKKQTAFRADNVSPLAMQTNPSKSSPDYVHYPVFSSQNPVLPSQNPVLPSQNLVLPSQNLVFSSQNPVFSSQTVQTFSESVPAGNEFYRSSVNSYLGSTIYSPISVSPSQTMFSTSTQNPSAMPALNSYNRTNQITNILQSLISTSALPIGQTACTALPTLSPLSNPSPPVVQEKHLIPPPNVLSNVPPPVGQVRHMIPPHSFLSNIPPPVGHITSQNYQRFLPTPSTLSNLTQPTGQARPSFLQPSNSYIHGQPELNQNRTFPSDNLSYPERVSQGSTSFSSSSNNLQTISNSPFARMPSSHDASQRGTRLESSTSFNDVQPTAEKLCPNQNDVPFTNFYPSPGTPDEILSTPPLPPEPDLPPLPAPEEVGLLTKIPSPPRKSTMLSYYQPNRNTLKSLPPRGRRTLTNFPKAADRKGASLLPPSLKSDVGNKYILTNDVYLILIEWNVDWMLEIDRELTVPPISETFLQVKNSYPDPLAYYNTYFPLLLLECWNKVCGALKKNRSKDSKKNYEWLCEIEIYDRKSTFINISCVAIIPKADVESIPKDGNIILVRLPLITTGSIKMLAYVHSSQHRAYSEKHDHNNKTIKNLKSTVGKLSKIRISFYIAFSADNISKDEFIKLYKLTSIKNFLKQNDALTDLSKSPLSKIILNPLHYNIFQMSLPHRKDPEEMTHVVQLLSENVQTPSEQLFLLKYTPFSDPLLAMFRLTEELKKSERRPKTLICVEPENLDHVGQNYIELGTFVILNRERENALHDSLKPFAFDRIVDELCKKSTMDQRLDNDSAHFEVLRNCDVILAVTTNCFYEDISALLSNKMIDLEICIIFQAHLFTEPESILPLQYGIKKLILIGDPEYPCKVGSKIAAGYDYNKSLFHRVYNCC